jgi:hypothetical protein
LNNGSQKRAKVAAALPESKAAIYTEAFKVITAFDSILPFHRSLIIELISEVSKSPSVRVSSSPRSVCSSFQSVQLANAGLLPEEYI